jgi:hypothetical protein
MMLSRAGGSSKLSCQDEELPPMPTQNLTYNSPENLTFKEVRVSDIMSI